MSEVLQLFKPWEIAAAASFAFAVQGFSFIVFSSSKPPAVQADISDEASRPMAVSITPVPLLRLGSQHPGKLPKSWNRHPSVAPRPTEAIPSPAVEADADSIPKTATTDAGPLFTSSLDQDAGILDATNRDAPSFDATSVEQGGLFDAQFDAPGSGAMELGSPEGSEHGTETDPLKARAINMYRAQLSSWFLSRFNIRGKIPFDTLKTLRATALVAVTGNRRVGGFSVTKPSGNEVFDSEVRAALTQAQASGAELPSPPPMYADVLGETIAVSFRCTTRSQCE